MARICLVSLDPNEMGGVQIRLAAFLSYAQARKHVCDIFYPTTRSQASGANHLESAESLGGLHPIRVPQSLPWFARMRLFSHRWQPQEHYDAHQLIAGSLSLGLPFGLRCKPFIAWIAGTYTAEVKAMPRTKLRHYYLYNRLCNHLLWRQEVQAGLAANLVLAVSSYSARSVRQELAIDENKVRVLPGPVDTEVFRPREPVSSPRRYILTVSRLHRGKGLTTLLRAFGRLVDLVPDVDLRIVGTGQEEKRLRSLAGKLRIEDRVSFLGVKQGDELRAEYQGASLFVLASRREALGMVLLEAMACGVPVVSTRCGGPLDPILNGQTGILVPVGDDLGMAQAMMQVLDNLRLARSLARAGRERVETDYCRHKVWQELDRCYEQVFGIESPEPGIC